MKFNLILPSSTNNLPDVFPYEERIERLKVIFLKDKIKRKNKKVKAL